jgi:hypothetical protein
MPKPRISEDTLTPAAKEVLDELLVDYRLQLLRGAEESASLALGEVREISVHDILASYERTKDTLRPRTSALTLLIARSGVFLTGILTLSLFVAFFAERDSSSDPFVAFFRSATSPWTILFGSLLGLTLAFTLYTRKAYRRETLLLSQANSWDAHPGTVELLRLWSAIEQALRELVVRRRGESSGRLSIGHMLDILRDTSVLTEKDTIALRALLHLRNRIAHGNADAAVEEIVGAVASANRLYARLSGLK